jgi:hypothetical protein
MMPKSHTVQTVKDIIQESKRSIDDITNPQIHGRLSKEQQEKMFQGAKDKLDPSIYKGDFQSYKEKGGNETGLEALKRMYKHVEILEDWLGNQMYEIQKGLPPEQSGHRFGNDKLPQSYSNSPVNMAKQYLASEGKALFTYLSSQGRKFHDITRFDTTDLGNAVAAVARYGNEAALILSKDFDKKVADFARHYKIPQQLAKTYVLDHEMVHLSQKGKGYDDHIQAELDVENTLQAFYKDMAKAYKSHAKEYNALAGVASERAATVHKNYSGMYSGLKGVGDIASKSAGSYRGGVGSTSYSGSKASAGASAGASASK